MSEKYDGVYHCAYCGKTFSIPDGQIKFLTHQANCPNKPNIADKLTTTAPDGLLTDEQITHIKSEVSIQWKATKEFKRYDKGEAYYYNKRLHELQHKAILKAQATLTARQIFEEIENAYKKRYGSYAEMADLLNAGDWQSLKSRYGG